MRPHDATRYPLAVGDEAWCLLLDVAGTASKSGDRKRLRGFARLRIAMICGEGYECVIITASGGVPGHRVTCSRNELYATHGLEHAAFGDLVFRLLFHNGAPDPSDGGPHVRDFLRQRERPFALAVWSDDGGRSGVS